MSSKISTSLILSLLLLQINVVSACSPATWPPLKFKAKDLIIKTNSLGPVYTNLSEYTVIFNDYSSDISCGPNKIYAKTPIVIAGLILAGILGGISLMLIFRKKDQTKWNGHEI